MAATLDQDFPPLTIARQTERQGVHKKLMEARLKLQGTKLNKSGHNKFAGYNYFELGDFLPAIQNIFAEVGLCGIVSYGRDEAWLTITDTEDGSSTAICSPMSTAALKGCHEVQNLGAVQTYIRRYLWVTAMEIVEHDALDATTGKKDPKRAEDEADAEWAEHHAMQVRGMMNKSDVEGAARFLNSLGTGGTYDGEAKELVWGRLESNVRSAIKAYDSITHAETVDALNNAWKAAPKHSHDMLLPHATKRKAELVPQQEAA